MINLGALFGGLKLSERLGRHYLFVRQGETPLPIDFAIIITLILGGLWFLLASRDGRPLRLRSGWDLSVVWLLAIPIGQLFCKLLGVAGVEAFGTLILPRGLLFYQLIFNALLVVITARMVHRAGR
jgi:hypothetical protein